jgi:hypothetical protein
MRRNPSTTNTNEYKNMLNDYRKTVRSKKNSHINKEVRDCGNDTKRLYCVVNKILGRSKSNPLPDHTDKRALAEEFNQYFLNKINNIQSELSGYVEFDPPEIQSEARLNSLYAMSEEDVKKLVSKTKPTTNNTDPMPSQQKIY